MIRITNSLALGAALGLSAVAAGQRPGCVGPLFDTISTWAMGGYGAQIALGDLNGDGRLDLVVAEDDALSGVTLFHVGVRLNLGGRAFGPEVRYPTTGRPQDVKLGDFDGDGDLDIAVSSPVTNGVNLLFGDGAGGFAQGNGLTVGAWCPHLAVGDFDEDGNLDLVVPAGNVVVLARGNGAGAFTLGVVASGLGLARDVAVADVDGDRHLDLVVVDILTDVVVAYRGLGNGTFSPAGTYAMGTWLRGVSLGDLDGDGRPDLACANNRGDRVAVRSFTGTPWFGALRFFDVGALSTDVAIVDFDQDGDGDLLVTNQANGTVTVLRGDGSGGLGAVSDHPAGPLPTSLACADIDGDGVLDIATSNASGPVGLLFGAGSSGFEAPRRIRVGGRTSGVVVADIDLDGIDDVVTSQSDPFVSVVYGGGSPLAARRLFPTLVGGQGLVAVDVEGDGDTDLAVQHFRGLDLHLADGAGGYLPPVPLHASSDPAGVTTGDWNGDGRADFAVIDAGSFSTPLTITVLTQRTPTSYTSTVLTPATAVRVLHALDLDEDGFDDLALGDSALRVLRSNGDGTFQAALAVPGTGQTGEITTADLDEDGHLDLVLCDDQLDRLQVLLGNGTLAPRVVGSLPSATYPVGVAVADLNHDGYQDLVVVNGNGSPKLTRWFAGDGRGGFGLVQDLPAGGVPESVAVADLDDDGNPEIVVANGSSGELTVHPNRCRALAVRFEQPGGGGAPVVLRDVNLQPGAETWNLFSFEPCPGAPGSGPASLLGLCASSPVGLQLLIDQLALPLGAAPFHFLATREQVEFGPWPSTALRGLTLDVLAIQLSPGPRFGVAAVQRLTIR